MRLKREQTLDEFRPETLNLKQPMVGRALHREMPVMLVVQRIFLRGWRRSKPERFKSQRC